MKSNASRAAASSNPTKLRLWLTACYPVISKKTDLGGGDRTSGDSTKSALIHLPAAGEGLAAREEEEEVGGGGRRRRWEEGGVSSKDLGDQRPPALGEVVTLCRSLMKGPEGRGGPEGLDAGDSGRELYRWATSSGGKAGRPQTRGSQVRSPESSCPPATVLLCKMLNWTLNGCKCNYAPHLRVEFWGSRVCR